MVVLESASGPVRDVRHSIVAITGLLDVAVYSDRVEISGLPRVTREAESVLLRSGVLVRDDAGLALRQPGALWELTDVLETLFAVDDESIGSDFGGGFFACFGYDTAQYVEELPRLIPAADSAPPDAFFSLVHALIRTEPASTEAELMIARCELWPDIDETALHRDLSMRNPRRGTHVPRPRSVRFEVTPEEYAGRVEVALDHIADGDIYQIQLGHQIEIETSVLPFDVYRRLRERNPSPYMSFAKIAGTSLVGASPELFVRLERGVVTMRPIAGTAPRSGDEARDLDARDALLADEKERAEHLMLVDLCRNDFGRVCRPASISVHELMVVEEYSHVMHLVSDVAGAARESVGAMELVRATFPAGTMTGAPKIRAMELIETLESSRRGLYAGAHGLIGFGGWCVLGLGIRMTTHHEGKYTVRASAGVVADSSADGEWNETLSKMAAAFWAVSNEELV